MFTEFILVTELPIAFPAGGFSPRYHLGCVCMTPGVLHEGSITDAVEFPGIVNQGGAPVLAQDALINEGPLAIPAVSTAAQGTEVLPQRMLIHEISFAFEAVGWANDEFARYCRTAAAVAKVRSQCPQ